MKLIALKALQRPGPGDKPVEVQVNGSFEADVGEAKALIRHGLAKAADELKAAAPPAVAAKP